MIKIDEDVLVRALYENILNRSPDQEGLKYHVQHLRASKDKNAELQTLIRSFTNSEEYRLGKDGAVGVGDQFYRVPCDLTQTNVEPDRVLVVGHCAAESFVGFLNYEKEQKSCATSADYCHFRHFSVPDPVTPFPPDLYKFQIVHLPLRTVIPESSYLRIDHTEPEKFYTLFVEAEARMRQLINESMFYNRTYGMLTFMLNFQLPVQNPMGMLVERYDYSNIVYFIEQLNRSMSTTIRNEFKSSYVVDQDAVWSTLGKRYIQDDVLHVFSHNGVLGDFDYELDEARLEAVTPPTTVYPSRKNQFYSALWHEIISGFRIVSQVDAIKLLIVDLDDTLWRGVFAEHGEAYNLTTEGWPLGLAEALIYLKRRGIILAIASKNEKVRIEQVWERIWGPTLKLEDFAIQEINWNAKIDNIERIIRTANVLPRSVLFIDDNPVERAAAKAAFPEIRVLGRNPYILRRVLLGSSETQVPNISDESSRRHEMIEAQTRREDFRKTVSKEEFLATLNVKAQAIVVEGIDHVAFPRCFELVNKTNQFNSDGRKWEMKEFDRLFEGGGELIAFRVEDNFTNYGIVAAVILLNNLIVQIVMSCRVFGLGIEQHLMTFLRDKVEKSGSSSLYGSILHTPSNLPVRDLFSRFGFVRDGEFGWRLDIQRTMD